MRNIFRYVISALWAIVFVFFALTLETLADELGYTKKIRTVAAEGWTAVDSAGYSSWVFTVFMLLTGAMLAVWIEYGLRKWESRKKIEIWAHIQFVIKDNQPELVEKFGADTVSVQGYGMYGRVYHSNVKPSKNVFTVFVVFEEDIVNPGIYISSDRTAIWREIKTTHRQATIEIDIVAKDDIALRIIIRPDSWSPGWKEGQPLRWNDTSVIPKDVILS